MSQSRVGDATETHISQTRYERIAHPAWLNGRLVRPTVVDGDVVIFVHAQHMRADLVPCINRLVAADPRWHRRAITGIRQSTDTQFFVRFQQVPAEQMPAGMAAVAIRGELGTVMLVREDCITQALAAELGPLLTAMVSGGTWGDEWRHRQAG